MRNKRLIIIFSLLLSITFMVLLGSIIFSVRTVDAYCANYIGHDTEEIFDGKTLSARVIEGANIQKGSSIFLVNENEIKDNVHNNVPEAKVLNVVHKFPNRIIIDYEYVYNYFEVSADNKYYNLRRDGIITSITDTSNPANSISLKANLSANREKSKCMLAPTDALIAECIINSLVRNTVTPHLNYTRDEVVTTMLDLIDLTRREEIVYLRLRSGTFIKIDGTDNILDKLNVALSCYFNDALFDAGEHKMILTYYNYFTNEIQAVPQADEDYYA